MDHILIYLLFSPFIIAFFIGYWKLFEKAGEEGWKSIIPVYNLVIHLKIIGKPSYWIFYLFIPIINVFVGVGIIIDLLNCFGRYKFYQHVAGILFGFFYFPYIAFKPDVKYLGTVDELPELKKSTSREWTEAIIFAVAAATIIRSLLMEAFTIPTPSMEKTLLVGDFLFVSKFHYGTRTPATPLQMPLTHQKIWMTDIPSYLDWVKLPQYRLPGFTSVKNNDVVVFNVPPISLNDNIDYPIDLKTNYIKRCVAIAGDVIKIEDQQVFINGKPAEVPEEMQFAYLVFSKNALSDRILSDIDISESHVVSLEPSGAVQLMYITKAQIASLEKLPFVTEVRKASNNPYKKFSPYEKGEIDSGIFPNDEELFPWNADWYGPVTIPKKGETIKIDRASLATYGDVITLYDHNENAKIREGKLFINGNEVQEYTFNQDYYFMMGDNRHNSLDSRYWGFVPEDHVVGKGFFIWLSLDPNKGLFSKIRWRRFFNLIE
jgi:signal peptidase I